MPRQWREAKAIRSEEDAQKAWRILSRRQTAFPSEAKSKEMINKTEEKANAEP